MDEGVIIFLVVIIILFIFPILIAKERGENYYNKYITFLGNNGIYLSLEDKNLIKYLVKDHYKGTMRGFMIGIGINFLYPLIPFIGIISILIILFTFISAFSKFQRECPFCRSKVKLDATKCHKCTKYIGNRWVGNPILEQFHRGRL